MCTVHSDRDWPVFQYKYDDLNSIVFVDMVSAVPVLQAVTAVNDVCHYTVVTIWHRCHDTVL